jgi:hypothetical protein
MINLNEIDKILITSKEEFYSFVREITQNNLSKSPIVGFDIETNGENFPNTLLAGFSLYEKNSKKACYVPLNHISRNILLEDIREPLKEIFNQCTLVTHGGAYDVLIMNKLGFNFYKIQDTYIIGNLLQFQNLGLKDLILEFGLVKYTEVVTYKKLMSILGFSEDQFDFTKIDIHSSKESFNYAINDSIFTLELYEILLKKYHALIGNSILADSNLEAQFNTLLLLTESSAKGYHIDTRFLTNFIDLYGREFDENETILLGEVRNTLGWEG